MKQANELELIERKEESARRLEAKSCSTERLVEMQVGADLQD